MSKAPREFCVPEEFVFNSTDEALDKYPDQAVSILWDMSDMRSALDELKEDFDRVCAIALERKHKAQKYKTKADKLAEVLEQALAEYKEEAESE